MIYLLQDKRAPFHEQMFSVASVQPLLSSTVSRLNGIKDDVPVLKGTNGRNFK